MAKTNIKGIWLPIDILANSELNDKEKIIEKVKHFMKALVSWVCKKLSARSEEQVMNDFERDTGINFDLDRQLDCKINEKEECELEL